DAGRRDRARDRRDRQPPRERRRSRERGGGGPDPRRQERRASHSRAQSRHDQVRHPRPGELRGGEELSQRERGGEADHAGAHDRHRHLSGHGVFRDLHDAHARVPEGGQVSRHHVRPHGEREPADLNAGGKSVPGRAVAAAGPGSRVRAIAIRRSSVKHTAMAVLLGAALGSMAFARAAEARNPHCAGGIQYVVKGLNYKNKGNFDDYKREMQKAVQQLEQCAPEDPADLEAVGYLGWAYAELDSSCLAGRMFDKAITGLEAKDKKKADWARNNRDSYWAIAFNNGITRINEAQAAYPDFQKAADNDADKALKEEARKKYLDAAANLTRASCLKPGDPRTLRNLGSAYAFTGDVEHARSYFEAGLKVAPNDSALVASMNSVHLQLAGALIDKGKFDEAVAIYSDVVKSDPKNSDLYLGLAEAHFKKAQSLQGDARKPEFKLAADAYAKAGERN